MKAAAQLVDHVARRLERTWSHELVGAPRAWPHQAPVGRAAKSALEGGFGTAVAAIDQLDTFAATHGLTLLKAARRVHGTTQQIPTHLVVPTIDAAASLAGGTWPATLRNGRAHAATITADHPDCRDAAGALRELSKMTRTDATLAFSAAAWFAQHAADARDLTPRQVPVEGLHAKWLNKRQALVANLAGLEQLGLRPAHPARVHLTYLDPAHVAAGGRRHDCLSVGDSVAPPYPVHVVVISENKDTAVAFPPVPGGIAVEGEGRGAGAVAAIGWLAHAERVFYWGDMDQDGLEILNEFRAAGIHAESMFMDTAAYEQYRRWGSNHDTSGAELTARSARPVPHLCGGELALYEHLSNPDASGPRRIEQERIPLGAAAEHVRWSMNREVFTLGH